MPAFEFRISEIVGSRREIVLRNRALPYRPFEFPAEQHYQQRWYPGNPVATVQALGPREGDLTIEGMWKSRYVFGDADLIGFDEIVDGANARAVDFPTLDLPIIFAEDLVEAMTRIRIAANTVRVSWGPEVRLGLLAKFTPRYQRIEDIEWSATFVWTQRGERQAPRASAATDPTADLLEAVNAVDDTVAAAPLELLDNEASAIQSNADDLRKSSVSLTTLLSDVQESATIGVQQIQAIGSVVSRVIQAGNALRGQADFPYVDLLPLDTVNIVTETEVWKRALSRDTTRVQASAVRAQERAREQAAPGVQRVVEVRENESLRTLALRFLGSADAWTVIADANDLVSSSVAPGTQVVIPRAPQAAGVV